MCLGNKLNKYTKINTRIWQWWDLSLDLFILYSKVILRGLEDLLGFIISGYNHNNTCYTDNTVLMENLEEEKSERTLRPGNQWKQKERTNY